LSSPIGASISNLENFKVREWSFHATERPLEIGEFANISGEAKCVEKSLVVEVLTTREGDSWRIKKMVPIEDRDH
jgi:hypothetical protein